ncbi:MAG: hypothetical protein EXX96DRAFT_611454 [Benjaminiella poitrasii]|nr:MAG: hypothetical protein EXX96DRAFT_611454 [Benjaminiella poitrasii]
MEKVSNVLIDKIINELYEAKELKEDFISILYAIFQDTLYEALHIAENNSVKKYQSESGRTVYRVSDACLQLKNKYRKDTFTCLLLPRHCTCDNFLKQVVIDDTMVMCRHLLAAILSDVLDILEFEQLNNELFAENYYNWIG